MNTVFLLLHIPNPRMNKRIAAAKQLGSVAVICVRRSSADIWEQYHNDVEQIVIDMDIPPVRDILKRVVYTRRFMRVAPSKLESLSPRVIYAEGLDTLMAAVKYKKRHGDVKIVFEAADLREAFISSSIKTAPIRRMEAKLLKSVDLLVLTSELFAKKHYDALVPKEKILFVPNMPDISAFEGFNKKAGGAFTVGFIGGIRYLTQMKLLVDAAGEVGANVVFAGAGGTSADYDAISQYCAGRDYVTFTGKYRYNEDIARLYGMVDCVFAVYDADNPNVRIALPNKLYESVYCSLPIIVSKGTHLSELVGEWGVGASVSHTDGAELASVLRRMMTDKAYMESLTSACNARRGDIDEKKYSDVLRERLGALLK